MLDGLNLPSFADYMLHIFWPAVERAGNHALLGKLKTADLPAETKAEQFAKLKALKPVGRRVSFGAAGDQVVKGQGSEGTFLYLTTERLTTNQRRELDEWAASEGLGVTSPDPADFLFVGLAFPGFLRLRDAFTEGKAINDVLDLVDDGYVGHDIYEVMGWYDRFEVLSIPKNWSGIDKSPVWIAARISSSLKGYRASGVTDEVASRLLFMLEIEQASEENVYFALTSAHPKQAFFEVYKFLETIFYLPWMQSLRDSLGLQSTALHLAKECRRELGWRGREGESVMRLFDMAPASIVQNPSLKAIKCFSDLQPGSAGSNTYGRRIYKIRNYLVHQEDYEDEAVLEVAEEEWPLITAYLLDVVRYLYMSWASDTPQAGQGIAA